VIAQPGQQRLELGGLRDEDRRLDLNHNRPRRGNGRYYQRELNESQGR
jgi:hypothetical protein